MRTLSTHNMDGEDLADELDQNPHRDCTLDDDGQWEKAEKRCQRAEQCERCPGITARGMQLREECKEVAVFRRSIQNPRVTQRHCKQSGQTRPDDQPGEGRGGPLTIEFHHEGAGYILVRHSSW